MRGREPEPDTRRERTRLRELDLLSRCGRVERLVPFEPSLSVHELALLSRSGRVEQGYSAL